MFLMFFRFWSRGCAMVLRQRLTDSGLWPTEVAFAYGGLYPVLGWPLSIFWIFVGLHPKVLIGTTDGRICIAKRVGYNGFREPIRTLPTGRVEVGRWYPLFRRVVVAGEKYWVFRADMQQFRELARRCERRR